jgi:hypothetical protein
MLFNVSSDLCDVINYSRYLISADNIKMCHAIDSAEY